MANAAISAAIQLAARLRGEDGVIASLTDQLSPDQAPAVQVFELYAAADLTEKAAHVKYPVIYVYCDRIRNTLKEKFRSFSGTADLNVEIRVSHDHLDALQEQLQLYVQSVTDVLDRGRGSWDDAIFYTGGYEITISPVKRGGRNYLQTARVQLEVHVNLD